MGYLNRFVGITGKFDLIRMYSMQAYAQYVKWRFLWYIAGHLKTRNEAVIYLNLSVVLL